MCDYKDNHALNSTENAADNWKQIYLYQYLHIESWPVMMNEAKEKNRH